MAKKQKPVTYRSMREERAYGPYWYAGLWAVLRPILIGLAVAAVVIGVLMTVWGKLYNGFIAPVDVRSSETTEFVVSSGQSLSRISANLEKAGLVRSKTVFKYYCDFSGLGQKLQSGTYQLSKSMSMGAIADRLTTGDGNPLIRKVTMIPGWTVEELAHKLATDGAIPSESAFLELCKTGSSFADFYYIADARAAANTNQRKYMLEGYLAADTYEVYTDAKPEDIIRKLLSQTERVFPADAQTRAQELGYTMDQMLTLASMIEKEAKPADFAKVSAVFHNRLKDGMKLQSDVTIHYISGVRKMALDAGDLKANSGYNTYVVSGLPVGPICTPSADAINAALYPDEQMLAEHYLYFCATDPKSGELHFSRTLQEHEQAVAIYAPLWKAYDEERGMR